MKALAWFGKKDVRVIDTPIPDITQPDDVIVKVTGTTICGRPSSPLVTFDHLILSQARISTCTTVKSSPYRRAISSATSSWV
jgi:hypothetical protein